MIFCRSQYTNIQTKMVGNTIVQVRLKGKAYSDVRRSLDTDTATLVAPTAKIIADPSKKAKSFPKIPKVQAIIGKCRRLKR